MVTNHAPSLSDAAILAKVERCRTRMMAQAPFFGALTMRVTLVKDTAGRFPTMATDGTHVFWNPRGCDRLTEPELIFVWAHEILHCGLLHMYRKPEWVTWGEWNVCTDYVINAELVRLTLGSRPVGTLYDASYGSLSAEQIAHIRRKAATPPPPPPTPPPTEPEDEDEDASEPEAGDTEDESESEGESEDEGEDESDTEGEDGQPSDSESEDGEDGSEDGTDGQPSDSTDTEGEPEPQSEDGTGESEDGTDSTDATEPDPNAIPGDDGTLTESSDCLPPAESDPTGDPTLPAPLTETDWQMAVEQAIAVTKKAGLMPGSTETLVAATRTTRTDWREALRTFVEQTTPSDYSWRRPNRRYASQGLYLPSTHKENTAPIVVVVDTSGSTAGCLDVFATELTVILNETRPRNISVIYCDTRVNGEPDIFDPTIDSEVTLTARGGGGTLFAPAFDWVADAIEDGTLSEPPACIVYLTDGYAYDLATLAEPATPTLFAIVPGGTTAMPFGTAIQMDLD